MSQVPLLSPTTNKTLCLPRCHSHFSSYIAFYCSTGEAKGEVLSVKWRCNHTLFLEGYYPPLLAFLHGHHEADGGKWQWSGLLSQSIKPQARRNSFDSAGSPNHHTEPTKCHSNKQRDRQHFSSQKGSSFQSEGDRRILFGSFLGAADVKCCQGTASQRWDKAFIKASIEGHQYNPGHLGSFLVQVK